MATSFMNKSKEGQNINWHVAVENLKTNLICNKYIYKANTTKLMKFFATSKVYDCCDDNMNQKYIQCLYKMENKDYPWSKAAWSQFVGNCSLSNKFLVSMTTIVELSFA